MADDTGRDWDAMLADLERRQREARAMGGPEKLERRRAEGRLDARARVEHLLDPGSFRELGTLVGGFDFVGAENAGGLRAPGGGVWNSPATDLSDIYVTTGGGQDRVENGPGAGGLFHFNAGIKGVPEFFSRVGL